MGKNSKLIEKNELKKGLAISSLHNGNDLTLQRYKFSPNYLIKLNLIPIKLHL